jgi:hypothetical protein
MSRKARQLSFAILVTDLDVQVNTIPVVPTLKPIWYMG